jgi:hypothetical protein
MARRLRFIPEGGALVEVTTRTLHGCFLLCPGSQLDEVILGILGHAQRRFEVQVCGFSFASDHYHLILWVNDARQLARFMHLVNSKLAKEIGRLTGWKEKVWSRRYQAIVISEEEAAQSGRLKYVLAHGVKENLVGRVLEWPGVHCAAALLDGEPLEGYWFDRTREYGARLRGEAFDRLRYAMRETVVLSPLPCWAHLSPERYRERVAALVAEIEAEAAVRRERTGIRPPGPAAIRAQRPQDRPQRLKKSPAPLFHAASQRVRKDLYEAYAWFVKVFREAAEKLREGDRTACFPPGSFPPALPFVAV